MKAKMIETRKEYIGLIKKELLGPGSEISIPDKEHELISSSPKSRYSIGILYPKNNQINADNDDTTKAENDTALQNEEQQMPEIENDSSESISAINSSAGNEDEFDYEEENLDEEIGLAAQNMPSSAGITFFTSIPVDRVTCKIKFATYRRALSTDCKLPIKVKDPTTFQLPLELAQTIRFDAETSALYLIDNNLSRRKINDFKQMNIIDFDEYNIYDCLYKLLEQHHKGYVRIPHETDIELDFSESEYVDNNSNIDGTFVKVTALKRNLGDSDSVTIMMVNDHFGNATGENCIFQPEIIISTADNQFAFAEYGGTPDFASLDDEEQSLQLQYRNKKVYATGLGTSADWDIDSNGRGTIYTEFFPMREVPSMDFTLPAECEVNPKVLSMKFLSDLDETPKEEKIGLMRNVVSAYDLWIESLNESANTLEEHYKNPAFKNISECMQAKNRMLEGLKTLETVDWAWSSFELANRAMLIQRVQIEVQKATQKEREIFPDDYDLQEILCNMNYYDIAENEHSWRPFQLAFLLMSINSIVYPDSEDRNIVDLIWFPTGGGKTEAYLGLTAFTIFYRKLSNLDKSAGTSVIMRYTLRLLAAQQFTRASTLICACEFIRQESLYKKSIYPKYPLGKKEISIGLWIGGEHTPNTNDKAREELKYLTKATVNTLKDAKDKHNKFQVLKCPWCGTKLVQEIDAKTKKKKGVFGYVMKDDRHFELRCPQENCFFNSNGKLPIQVVDEELYDNPPTLLFGTVDKFAMLPWNKKIGSFFAVNSNNMSPDLIIQDELHLISGPLGTMVGLYETIVDSLCSSKGLKTKIIASTATIRRAKEQCSSLYNRPVSQFPPPGLNAEDSFFARESVVDYSKNKYGRMYVGLMPSGKTKAMMEARSIAAMVQRIKMMDLPDNIKDKYWTLTVYFNSLKDLGKCVTLVDDDVKNFIRTTAYRLGVQKDARLIVGGDELTSRVSTTELNETLDKLEKKEYSVENIKQKRYPSDILLATNMISVGIDIARLNVMLLVGQPKLTSEYIQASSRIGRSFPGVAFAMYDSSKSRDRSHYEQFRAYHDSFYKFVEPTGVTPFSKPARDRALHAVVISLLRHLESELSDEKAAGNFAVSKYQEKIDEIKNIIITRNAEIMHRSYPSMDDESAAINSEIDTLLERWDNLAELYQENLFFGEKVMKGGTKENDQEILMKMFNTHPNFKESFETMTSMRNVDSTVAGHVLIWED